MQQAVEGFRLSPQQARLWLFRQQSTAYRGQCSVLIKGQLDIARLRHALETVLAHHDIYRTCFERIPGISLPVQVVNADPLYSWQEVDLAASEPQDQHRQIKELQRAEIMTCVDIERGPLVYSTILTITEHQSIWLLHLSALHADPQSLKNLVSEIAYCYRTPTMRSDDLIQYIQFSEWQNELLQESREDERAYWQEKDFSTFFASSLPFKNREKIQAPFSPDVLILPLYHVEYTQLEALLAKQQWTLPIFLLACWYIQLWKLTGHNAIMIGLSADGRIEDLRDSAGLIAKYLPLTCSLNNQQTVRDLVTQIQDAYDELFSHQPYFNWDELMGTSSPASFLYPFHFEWREQPELLMAGPVSFTLQQWESYFEPFHVKLVGIRASTGLTIQLHFDRNLFSIQHIQRIAEQFALLVERIVKQPEQHLGELDILSTVEREQLLMQFNQNTADYPYDLCLHQMFEQQAARSPDAIAVVSEQEQLTYAQLNRRANHLAWYLQHLGVGPEILVGIGLKQSLESVISILGILKAGGVYVPLNTTYPELRLASIVADAHISVLLTTTSLRASLPRVEQVVCLDNDWPSIVRYNGDEPPISAVLPTNLAYVMYTSGSTGQPKGVMIPHRAVVHYVDWSSKHYGVAAGSGSPVHSPLSFDLTITSLFPSLVVGRRLVLIPDEPGVETLSQILLQENEFSLLKITPAHLNLLAQSLLGEKFAAVAQSLIIGGEALHSESVSAWREHAPAMRLINEYGPTETAVGCCIYEISQDEELVGVVPIGRPIPNTQLYLLDAQLRVVPFGTPGELYIGGVGVGHGYLNRPDLTAESFIANPFSLEPGTRLYKTGDMARYISADGTLEYLGRIDTQIKLRGYRIELAEIEAVLRQHPQIADCVVLLQEEGSGAPRLIGYVVARATSVFTVEAASEMLRKYLPSYMVPSIFVVLDALPLTTNGKVDRGQLPRPERTQGRELAVQNKPRNPIEETLLKMWRELLTMPSLGIHDNFFAAGGHSLLATRLIAQIRAVLLIEISVRAIFDAPTVAELAKRVNEVSSDNNNKLQEMPPLVPVERPEEIPLSFAQHRLWFLDRLQPDSSAYLISRAQSFQGPVSMQALENSLEELVHRHETLRTTFAARSGQPVQIIHAPESYCLPLIDLCGLKVDQKKAEARHLSKVEARRLCDLEQGPLLRTYLVRLDNEEHVLLLTLHHIITDGWSDEVLVDELITLYRAYLAKKPSPLAPLRIQYVDYTIWQRQWLQGKVLDAQLDYWVRQLGGVRPTELPVDYHYPSLPSSRGALHSFALSEELSHALITLSHREGVTLFMLLLATFQILFYRFTGQSDIVVGTDSANRNQLETEGMIGFFVNILALRVDLSGSPSFREVLKRVRSVVVAAYSHSETPFELLVEKLASDHHLERMPLVQVLFVLQNLPVNVQKLTDTTSQIKSKEPDQSWHHETDREMDKEAVVKFDLALFMQERAGKLFGTLSYRLDLFQTSTIATMMARFIVLLQSVVDQPDTPIDILNMISDVEIEQNEKEKQRRRETLQLHNDGWFDLPAMKLSEGTNDA